MQMDGAAMTTGIIYRPARMNDIGSAYAVFRRSIFDYLFRLGMVDEATAKDPPIEASWKRQSAWMEHLWRSAAENWIAVDSAGSIVGWAMSVERDGHLELTHFSVEPRVQAKGIGQGLIKRAFPDGRARHKSIIATQDTRALSLYLRFGLNYITTSAEFVITPRRIEPMTDLVFERVGVDDAAVEAIALLERATLGYRQDVDTRFLLGLRPAWLARRAGSVVGFAFGPPPMLPNSDGQIASSGPMAALDAHDLPAILDHVIDAAAMTGEGQFGILVPLINRVAVAHLVARGGKIDPFYVTILASEDSMRLESLIHTRPP